MRFNLLAISAGKNFKGVAAIYETVIVTTSGFFFSTTKFETRSLRRPSLKGGLRICIDYSPLIGTP